MNEKEKVLSALSRAKDDARYHIYHFTERDTFVSSVEEKSYVLDLVEKASEEEVYVYTKLADVMIIGDHIGVSISDFAENIYYETLNTEGYEEHQNKHRKYHNIFIKLDKENKTISFKIADKEKTLTLKEEGLKGYVSKPSGKYMRCVSADSLDKHIHDEFWNPRMILLGRQVLCIPDTI